MEGIIVWFLVTFAIVETWCTSKLFSKPREWIISYVGKIKLITCPICLSFWVGALAALYYEPIYVPIMNIGELIFSGFLMLGMMYILYPIYKIISEKADL